MNQPDGSRRSGSEGEHRRSSSISRAKSGSYKTNKKERNLKKKKNKNQHSKPFTVFMSIVLMIAIMVGFAAAGGLIGGYVALIRSIPDLGLSGIQPRTYTTVVYNNENKELSKRISALPGKKNEAGGAIKFVPLSSEELSKANYKELVETRHSIRHFSDKPVELERVENAVKLAQYTPSACNRQGWKTYIVNDKAVLREVLKNQNGNRGFGQEFDKLLVVVGDLRCFNRDREVFQVYIDGGMYAMRVLDSLYYERIASVPLSASLTKEQEENVRKLLKLDPAEVLIMFIGIGNYPDECQTTRSERKPAEYTVI